MKFSLLIIFCLFLLFSCTQEMKNTRNFKIRKEISYSSKGFALIYEDFLYDDKIVNRKLNNEKYHVLHSSLKSMTLVKIYNPENSESVVAKVKNISKFPAIYNSVITKKIADDLNLDTENPYIEIVKIKKNTKFTAKEASIYDEEKKVANTAPVSNVSINDLSNATPKINVKKKKPSYIVNIAEFYYYESAKNVKDRFEKEEKLMNIKIKEISANKFEVYSGPYDSFDSMKSIFFRLNKLGFDNLNVININK